MQLCIRWSSNTKCWLSTAYLKTNWRRGVVSFCAVRKHLLMFSLCSLKLGNSPIRIWPRLLGSWKPPECFPDAHISLRIPSQGPSSVGLRRHFPGASHWFQMSNGSEILASRIARCKLQDSRLPDSNLTVLKGSKISKFEPTQA